MNSKVKKRNDTTSKSIPVVGIGASAGGFDALEAFLAEMPEDFGFAIVFIQHLSPNHESLLPDLLRSRRPELDVDEISDGFELLPGKLYVCPPGKEVRIEKGTFHISSRPEGHTHLPIDEFFTSLAGDIAGRTIAVILSGAGTDGASGIQAVRKAGGTVFVQDPATAEFPAMPLAAIDTEVMDAVLSPADIAREILKLHGSGVVSVTDLASLADFEAFYQAISEKTGYRFNHYKKSVVARRIRRRMYLHGVSSVGAYLEMLGKNDSEAPALASDLMIGVTSFFRDKISWKALHLEVTRKLALMEDDTPVRVWTPACATGEEAYSIAMMLQHELDMSGRRREIQVFATDVNDRALETAREGTYPASIASDVPPEYVTKFFTPSGDGLSLTINKDIRQRIVFAKQDLLTDPPFSRLDLVICRNLLIYLEPDAQEKCIALFHYALKPGGYLFLGNAESPGRGNTLFTTLAHKKCRVYRALEVREPARMPLVVPFAGEHPAPPPARQAGADLRQSLTEYIHQALLEEFAPAAVAITQAFDIIFNTGPTHRYLRQPYGAPTQNLLDLLPKHLHNRVRAALYRASEEMKPVSIRTNMADEGGRKRQVAIRISKLRENVFLATFKEKGGIVEEAGSPEGSSVEETATRQLESELSATRDSLQSNIEQLKSLNEELHSSNEELQAANEELETSREELQSLNEELVAVNTQLQTKIEEQDETNNDLNNLLTSTSIPTIFLDYHFRVRRFTPAMSKLIKLIASDVGRPIIDMSRENLGPDLISDAQSVLDQLAPVRREFSIDGAWYVRTTLPYRTSSNRIEGVVVTYTDISERKLAELSLSESEERLRLLVEGVQDYAIFMLDEHGRVASWNSGAERIKGWKEQEILGQNFSRFYPPELIEQDLPRRELEIATAAGQYHEEGQRLRKDGSRFWADVTITALRTAEGRLRGFAKLVHDITERKEAENKLRESLRALEESENFYREVGDMLPYGIWINRYPEGDNVFLSQCYLDMVGMTREEHQGYGWKTTLHPDDREAYVGKWLDFLKSGRTDWEEEFRVRDKEGAYRTILSRGRPIRNKEGRIIAYGGVNFDITERKAAEERIRHLASFPELNPSPVLEVDASGKITFCNTGTPETLEGLGMDRGDCEAFLPEDLGSILQDWDRQSRSTLRREALLGARVFEETIHLVPEFGAARIYAQDVTERRQAEAEREMAAGFLRILNEKGTKEELIRDTITFFQEKSGCEAVGIRLKDGDDYPYYEARGFPKEFLLLENSVCSRDAAGEALCDSLGYPIMECMCGNVIQGRFDPSKPFFSPRGSFWSNCTTELLATSTEEDRQTRTRNRCNGEGYESVALIALRTGEETFGLLQLNDRRKDRFSPRLIDLWERLADNLSVALAKAEAEAAVRTARDELELRVAERTAEVEKERRRLYDVLETLPAMICLLTPDHHVAFANRSFREKFGEAKGRHCYEYCFGFPQPCDFCESYKVLETGKPHHWQVTTPDSSSVIDAHDFPFTDADGSPLILEMDLDITEQRQAETALRLASAYNRSLIEASLDPLVTISPEGRISDVNAATEQATGYSRDELIGTDFSDYFTNPEKARAGYRKVFDEGFVRDYPLNIRHRDGRITPVLYNAAVYRDETGSVTGIFAAARDISEQEKLESQLRQAQKLEALGTLSGGIAHDFNNMLAAIIGFTELIKDHSTEESRERHHAQRVLDAAVRGRELVRQMLTFSRQTEQEKKPLRLSSIVKESIELLRASIPSTVSIRVDIKSESGVILADPTQTQQVLVNLAANAAYAMREKGGALDIELSDFSVSPSMANPHDIEPGLYMKLTVQDTGMGIPPEIIDRIFDPFFTTKKVGEGTGLGLSVVLGIVKQTHGYITVESEPGKGSTFDVYFPKIVEESTVEEAVGDETIPLGSERILFVDDEEALVEMGEELLAELGYDVTCRTSSTEALALFRLDPFRFDLVVTDQTMPEMTGIKLAKEILAIRPDIPVILCTGFSHTASEESARAAGIKGFVMKPLTKREIARAVRQALDG